MARSQNSLPGASSFPNGLVLNAKHEKCLQVEWRKVPSEDVSSRASPEVLGAVDLLSLKRATWGKAAPFQSHVRVSRHPGKYMIGSDAPHMTAKLSVIAGLPLQIQIMAVPPLLVTRLWLCAVTTTCKPQHH